MSNKTFNTPDELILAVSPDANLASMSADEKLQVASLYFRNLPASARPVVTFTLADGRVVRS
jgi:hypothetical protein